MPLMTARSNLWAFGLRVGLVLGSLAGFGGSAAQAASRLSITGAGATFPYPLYLKWMSEFQKKNTAVELNYQSIGSGGGIRQLLKKTVDYGASDAPMKDDQLKEAKLQIFHFPTVMGAVALTYNIPGVTQSLKITPEIVADLFFGKIYYWDDAKIQTLNPEVKLPHVPTLVVYRADGSGTTAVFTEYLSRVSPTWKEKIGAGTSVKWPVGIGGKGNEGVTGFIKNFPGALGYVELLYAEKNHLPVAQMKNREGNFIKPSSDSVTAAAAAYLKDIPADFRFSLTNAPGKESYPIASFTYLLIYKKNPAAISTTLKEYLNWIYLDGQKLAAELYYAPLPKDLLDRVRTQISQVE